MRLYCLYALYTIATQISDFNYPIDELGYSITSVIFGKPLYLIPQKMPSKRYHRRVVNLANLYLFPIS
jgi:hypothetical protein